MAIKVKISSSSLKKIETPESGFTRVWDTEVIGFGARVRANGKISFVFRYRNQYGKEKQYTIGHDLAPDHARKLARKKSGEVAEGLDPVQEKLESKEVGLTFDDLSSRYQAEILEKRNAATTVSDYKRHLNYLSPILGRKLLTEIWEGDIKKVQSQVKETKGLRSSNVMVTMLKTMFNIALKDWRLISHNPCEHVKKFKETPRTERFSGEEMLKVLESIKEEENPYVRVFFITLIHTACRRGELQKMKWSDIDLSKGEWKKPKDDAKIRESHLIVLNKTCIDQIRSLKKQEGNPYVFCGKMKGKPINGFSRFWGRILGRCGVSRITIHDIRRSMGCILLSEGLPIEQISQLMGHTSTKTTERVYAALGLKSKKHTVDVIERVLS